VLEHSLLALASCTRREQPHRALLHCRMEELPRYAIFTDPEVVRERIEDGYFEIGHLLDNIDEPAILVDALCKDFPIVGASRGFCAMSGFALDYVKGRNCRMMFDGVPSVVISRSSRKNVADFCNMCRVEGVEDLSEVSAVQPNARRDGSHFVNLFVLSLCKVNGRQYILGVQRNMNEGLMATVKRSQMADETEALRSVLKRIRHRVADSPLRQARLHSVSWPCKPPSGCEAAPDFAFYASRLQDHCMLLNNGFTAVRREPQELAFNCLNFGDRPVQPGPEGLRFAVRVDGVTDSFRGLPVLGFTKRRPADSADLFPSVARCLGSSVLVGGDGEAFARDQHSHFKMGFKQPPQEEVQRWSTSADGKAATPPTVRRGDLFQCTYSHAGQIRLRRNGEVLVEFDTGRPLDAASAYYAVVDVCLSTHALTLVPSDSSWGAAGEEAAAPRAPPATTEPEPLDVLKTHSEASTGVSSEPADVEFRPLPSTKGCQEEEAGRRRPEQSCMSRSRGLKLESLEDVLSTGAQLTRLAVVPKTDNVLVSLAGTTMRGSAGDVATIAVGLLVLAGTMLLLPGKPFRR